MKLSAFLLAAAVIAFPAHAQTDPWVNGEVRRIDAAAGKVTLRHDYIPVIDMPPMTMVFIAERGMLETVKVGDAIRFQVDVVNGKFFATKIEALPDAPSK